MINDNVNDMQILERLMIEYGVCVRAIPNRVRGVYARRHINSPKLSGPNVIRKEIVYLKKYKRKMLVVEKIPNHAGMFLIETGIGTSAKVRFSGRRYYKTLKEAMDDIERASEMS